MASAAAISPRRLSGVGNAAPSLPRVSGRSQAEPSQHLPVRDASPAGFRLPRGHLFRPRYPQSVNPPRDVLLPLKLWRAVRFADHPSDDRDRGARLPGDFRKRQALRPKSPNLLHGSNTAGHHHGPERTCEEMEVCAAPAARAFSVGSLRTVSGVVEVVLALFGGEPFVAFAAQFFGLGDRSRLRLARVLPAPR